MNRRNPLGEPVWALDSTWKKRKESLVTFPSGFSILELCAGAGTASLALKLLLGSDCLAGAWDTDNNLESIYKLIHGNHPGVHLGQTRGDILNTPLHAFPCANAVVCGPPCQPYSAMDSEVRWMTREQLLSSAASTSSRSCPAGARAAKPH